MTTAAKDLNVDQAIQGPLAEAQEAIEHFSTNSSAKVDNLIKTFERLYQIISEKG
jgi:hypothetical protein